MKRAYGLYITIAVAGLLLTVYATRHRVHANTYTVTTTADSGAGSLRQAILDANANPGLDTIEFNIGTGTPTISPTSALPTITSPVIINGNTGGATRVELNGSSAGVGTHGLNITAGGSTVRSMVINGFGLAYGIGLSTNGGNVIEGNYIGTNAAGTAALANGIGGIYINAPNNTIGGTAAGARNVISGNGGPGVLIDGSAATGNKVEGNYIGTDVNGTVPLGNGLDGVSIFGAPSNTIGGTAAGARNVISGNTTAGVHLLFNGASGNKIEGNYIGTDASGTANLANSSSGVVINEAPNNIVGGTAAGARNLISGIGRGVHIANSGASGNRVEGNYIGTDANGTADLGNTLDGVFITNAPNNTVGGTAAGARNVISGNGGSGVAIEGSAATGNKVEGNYIGTDANGSADLGNSFRGVTINGAPNTTIGGTAAGAGNVISGNDDIGVVISGNGASGNKVEGNYIGTDVSGTADLGNSFDGVFTDAPNTTVGGTAAGAGNVISGNDRQGVVITSNVGNITSGNRVEGNYIGTDASGTADLGNSGDGIRITSNTQNNTIGGTAAGAANLIAFNDGNGVLVSGSGATGQAIRGNSIHSNTNIGIDLTGDGVTLNDPLVPGCPADTDTGPNNLQNYPVITLASASVQGFLNSTANTTFTLDFYSSPAPDSSGFGEGQTYLGSATVTTDASCMASFDVTFMPSLPAGEWITATATDPNGNTSEFSAAQLVTLPCTLTCPENITEPSSAGQCGAVVSYSAPVTSGDCGTVSCAPASGSFFPVGTTTVTCSVAGGPSCSFTVTVNDTQAPTVTCPGNIDATAPPQQTCAVVEYTTPTANDNCTATVNCLPASGTCFALGTTTVTCTATDASQNTGTCTFTITVTQQSCAITCPSNITQDNDSNQCGAVVTYTTPTPPKGCGAVTCAPASGSFFATGTTTVTCTVAGGPSCAFTVTVNDTQAPTVTCPAHIDATAPPGENCVAVSYTTPAANDNCTATVNCLPASGTCFALGTTTVTCTATDASQNTGNCTFTITVTQQSCAITCPSNIAQNNDSNQCGAVVTYTTPTPPKGCGAVTCAPASGSFFAPGTTTVTCSVAGGPSCSFNVTVNDTQAPTVACPAHMDATAPPNENCTAVNYTTPSANDNCPGASVNCLPASGTCFAVGTTTVTCTATDASQNSGSCSFTITVTQQVCTITCPANITKNNDPDQCGAVATFATPVPPQGCGAVTCAPASGSFFAKGATTVTCSVAGGPSCSFTVTVNDTQPPSIACPSNMSATAPPGQTCAVVNYTTPTASDNCTGSTVSCAPASGTCFPIGTTTVTCTAMDASKNTGSCSFTVTVAPPCMITCPANITKNNDPNQCGAVVTFSPTTSGGDCGTVNCSPASGSFFPKGTTTVTCSTTAGPSCSFLVTVNDTQPPTIACPASINIAAEATCPPTSSKAVSFSATATDNCPGVNVVCSPASGSMFPVGTTSVTCVATDSSGNTAHCSFGVSVFSACLADQSNPGNVVLFNTQTGDYRFCCSGVLLATGTGVLTIRGCIGTIDHQKGDRKVHIGFDFSANNGHGAGTAALFLGGSTNPKCSITDQMMAGNVCTCPSAPPQAGHK